MSLDSLRNGIVYSMQMNHGTIDSSGQNPAGTNNGATPIIGNNTYEFIDNFDGSSVNSSYWTSYTSNGNISVSGGVITLNQTTSNGIARIISNQRHTPFDDISLDCEVTSLSGSYKESGISIFRDELTNTYEAGRNIMIAQSSYDNTLRLCIRNSDSTRTIYNIKTSWTPKTGMFGLKYYYNGGSPYVEVYYNDTLQGSHTLTTTEKNYLLSKTSTDFRTMISAESWVSNELIALTSVKLSVTAGIHPNIKLGTGAYIFDGTNDYINTNKIFNINDGTTYSLSFWIYINSNIIPNNGDYQYIFGSDGGNTYELYMARIINEGGNKYLDFYAFGGGAEILRIPFNNNIIENNWNHIVYITNKNNIQIYENKRKVVFINNNYYSNNSYYGSSNINDNFVIGCLNHNGVFKNYFNGIIDDVNIWNRGLNLAEATELYNNGDGLELFPGVADGVISAYKFDGDATDSALYSSDITLTNHNFNTGKINNGTFAITDTSYGVHSKYHFNNYGTQNFTIGFWFYGKQPPTGKYSMIYGEFYNTSPYPGPAIFYDPHTSNRFLFRTSNQEELNITSPGASTLYDKWTYITFIRENGILKVYYDGVLVGSRSSNTNLGSFNNKFIAGRPSQDLYTGMGLDEFTIWNRALSSDENIYNSGNGLQYDFIIEEVSGYLIKRYNGTSWEEYPVKVYNGTEWVDAKVKRYNGSEWVEL